MGFFFSLFFMVLFAITRDPFCFIVAVTIAALDLATFLTKKSKEVGEQKCPPHKWEPQDGLLLCKLCGKRPQQ